MQRARAITLCLIASALGSLGLVGVAGAATTAWGPPMQLSPPEEVSSNSSLAVNEEGSAEVVWQNYDAPSIQGSAKAAHGGWDRRLGISTGELEESVPTVGIDGQGDALALWHGYSPTSNLRVIETAEGPAGGSWGSPGRLFGSEEGGLGDPQVAVDSRGDAVAIWTRVQETGGINSERIESSSKPAGGDWTAAVGVSPPEAELTYSRVAIDAAGEAIVIWDGSDGVEAAAKPASGAWKAPVSLSTAEKEWGEPQVSIDAAGEAVAVWHEYAGPISVVDTASRPAVGGWSAVTEISSSGADSPSVVIGADGDAVAVWGVAKSIREEEVRSASRPAGGQWADGVAIPGAEGEEISEPGVAMEGGGTAVAVWNLERFGVADGAIKAASLPPGGKWSPAETISKRNPGESHIFWQLKLAADSDGAVAAWHAYFEQIEAVTLAPVHQLSVSVSGSGGGAVESSPAGIKCGGKCEDGLVEGTPIKLTGTPALNSGPAEWVHCPGVVNPSDECEVTMGEADEEALVTFDQKTAPAATPSPSSPAPSSPPSLLPPGNPSERASRPVLLYGPHRQAIDSKSHSRYTFGFTDADSSATFLCSIGRSAFNACRSPVTYHGLSGGKHSFRVKAVGSNEEPSLALSVVFWAARRQH